LRESEPLGTAGALSLLIDKPALPFVVTNADLVSSEHRGAIVDFHNDQQSDATMAVQNFELQNPFGVVEVSNGDIVSIIEKPVSVSKISGGIYVLDPQMLDLLEPGKYCDMPELFRRAIDASMEVKAFMIHEEWADIGRESDLIKIQNK
jgi:NDP-sugar pyrophosphorylase family protein